MKPMTMRERLLAVLEGRELDRVPFVQYRDLAAPREDIWAALGRENMGILATARVHQFEHPNCRMEHTEFERDGRRGVRTVLHTPAGSLTQEKLYQPDLGCMGMTQHFVREREDYDILIAHLRDITVAEGREEFLRADREVGDDGLVHTWLIRTPYQQLWVQWVSMEDLAIHMVDCADKVNECMTLLTNMERRILQIVRDTDMPVPYVVFPDNITAPMIGPKNFVKFCVPLYNECADVLADKNLPVFVHMDGDVKPLWQAIGESKIDGIDSLAPPPDNDTSVGQAAEMWPEMRLFVNFPSSVHLAQPDDIYAQAMQILEEAGHTGRLEIQISENVPPGVWRKSFPEIVRAINDFGAP